MDYKITGYEPAKLFHYFEEISAIPRESGNEKQISDYLVVTFVMSRWDGVASGRRAQGMGLLSSAGWFPRHNSGNI